MKAGASLLRAVALVCTSLALTACGAAMTPEEAAAGEAAALATVESELGSCGTWSGWTNVGVADCQTSTSCGFYYRCERYLKAGDPESAPDEGGPENRPPACPPGETAVRYYNDGLYNKQSSYRVCFNDAGTYTHTEYQYQNVLNSCSC